MTARSCLHPVKKWRFRALLALGAVLLFSFILLSRPTDDPVGPAVPSRPSNGIYAPRTVLTSPQERAEDLYRAGITRYYHLVYDQSFSGAVSTSSWDSVGPLAEAMGSRGIEMIIYIVPPAETGGPATYLPYGHDYEAWATAVAELARKHPAIKGMAIDDMGGGADSRKNGIFSPAYVRRIQARLKAIDHRLRLYGVLYAQDFSGQTSTIGRLRSGLDGVIYPFTGLSNFSQARLNSTDPHGVSLGAKRVRQLTDCSGTSSCWNFDLRSEGPSGSWASATTQVSVPPGTHQISFRVKHTIFDSNRDTFNLSVSTDTTSRPISPTLDSRSGKYSATFDSLSTSNSLTVKLSLPAPNRAATAQISDMMLDGSPIKGATQFAISSPRSALAESAHPLELFLMIYAAKLGSERGIDAANPDYFDKVMAQAIATRESGLVDGIVVYRPSNLPERGTEFHANPANWKIMEYYYRER